MNVNVAHLSRPRVGEIQNGDHSMVRHDDQERMLLAVIDGLGHGPGAAEVSRRSAEYLGTASLDQEAHVLMEQLHYELQGTRGVAATLCVLDSGTISACAVGNVECRTVRMRLPLVFSAGILGGRVRKFRACSAPLVAGARLVMFSDGISSRIQVSDFGQLKPQPACEVIMERYRREEDDSTVLIADVG